MTTPPTDYKKLAEDALNSPGVNEAIKLAHAVLALYAELEHLKPEVILARDDLARAKDKVRALEAQNFSLQGAFTIAGKSNRELNAENQRLRAATAAETAEASVTRGREALERK